jgi:hypothetical protein
MIIKFGKNFKRFLKIGTDMMIEADVSMGIVTGREGKFLPIMAHPPFKSSDLSLEEFLDTTLSSRTPKGIKLDFKDMEAVELSLRTIKTRANKVFICGDLLSLTIKRPKILFLIILTQHGNFY